MGDVIPLRPWTRGAPDPAASMVRQVRLVGGWQSRPIGLANRITAGVWEISYPLVAAFPLTDDDPNWEQREHAPVEEPE